MRAIPGALRKAFSRCRVRSTYPSARSRVPAYRADRDHLQTASGDSPALCRRPKTASASDAEPYFLKPRRVTGSLATSLDTEPGHDGARTPAGRGFSEARSV